MDWESWKEIDERSRHQLLISGDFWAGLSDQQRETFIRDADWQELRHVPEARQRKLSSLSSLDQVCSTLRLSAVEVYWLMSTRKLPGWLVDGVWKFDLAAVQEWVKGMGGLEAVSKDIQEQMAKHKAGASGT